MATTILSLLYAIRPWTPTAEQPLTDYDRDNIDSAMQLWRSSFTSGEAAAVCAAVAHQFQSMYPSNVFRGSDDSPLKLDGGDVHHLGAYYDGNIHWDPRYLDGVNDGKYPLSALARSALHEDAHALGYGHDSDGVYDEEAYEWIHSTGPDGCVDS